MLHRLICLLLLTPCLLSALATTCNDRYKQQCEPAFEKIYVKQCQLCTFYDGTYYFDEEGNSTKVKAVLHDYDGMYIILVKHQCPLCGRCWEGDEPDDEHGCPIFQREVLPSLWSRK